MFSIAYHSDPRHLDYWDQLRVVFRLKVFEIGGPIENINPSSGWEVVNTVQDLKGPVVFFNPQNAPLQPGGLSLNDFDHPQDVT